MLFVEGSQSFGRDPVILSSTMVRNGRLEPSLLDPLDHLRGANAHGISQGLHRKAIAADIADAQLPSVESVPDGSWASLQLLGNFLDGVFREQFTRLVEFFRLPSTVVGLGLDTVLDHKSPAFLI
jgi:hypothetical protein